MILSRDPNYRRLKVGGRGALGTASYWLGPDHLLVVEVVSYVERYRRFYYREVQAIIVRRTKAQQTTNLALGVLALLALVAVLIIAADQGPGVWSTEGIVGAFVFSLAAAALLVGLLLNVLRGPTCACRIHTAVQALDLPRIRRWKMAERLLDELKPLVTAAQSAGARAIDFQSAPRTAPSENPGGLAEGAGAG
jgi:hypothetical protein